MLELDHPQHSRIQRMSLRLLADRGQLVQAKIEGQRRSETGTARFHSLSCQEKERFVSYMRNLFSKHLRNQISELHFRKLPDSADFQFVKVNLQDSSMLLLGMSHNRNFNGSTKCRWPDQWTTGAISPIFQCLMRRQRPLKRIISSQHFW